MHKTSLLQSCSLIHTIVTFTLCALVASTPVRVVKADAAPPPDPTVSGVGPYQPQKTNVQMMSETVFIDVPHSPSNVQEPKQIRVNAKFTMRNQGPTEEQMQVIFPLTRLGPGIQSLYEIDLSSFTVKVDGRRVTITEITTPPEVINYPEVRWAAFEVTFPVQQDVLLQVEYEMLNPYGEYEGFTGIAYILETGAGWYGNILSAEITLHLPYPVTEDAILEAKLGYIISGNEMQWKLKDIEPTREDNLEIRVINVDVWQSILKLRDRVEKYPEDADAWSELGDQYMERAIFMREGIFMGSSPHFTGLTVEARQKVVDSRPDWGDAHYKLAEILWLGNPNIQNALRKGGESTAPDPSLQDPAIQQALQELQLAWSLGVQDSLPYLNLVFPELVLIVDAIATITIVPPTLTFTPIATSNMLPTVPATLSTAVSPTLIPVPIETSSRSNNNVLLIMLLGVLIAGGAFIYQLKSRLRGTK